MINLTFILQLLKGFYGNQVWGELMKIGLPNIHSLLWQYDMAMTHLQLLHIS